MKRRIVRVSLMLVLLSFVLTPVLHAVLAEGDPPTPQDVTIPGMVEKSINGVTTTDIQGTFYGAPPNGGSLHPAILMLPMLSGMTPTGHITADRAELTPLAQAFQRRGVSALTIDLTGYTWGTGQPPTMVEGTADVQAALDWLKMQPGVDPARISVLGSSIGANYALILLENNLDLVLGIIFSPAPDYGGLQPNPAALVERSVLVYAGSEETASDAAYNEWLQQFPNFRIPGSGHGSMLFANPADLDTELDIWLDVMGIFADLEAGEISGFEAMDELCGLLCGMPFLLMAAGGLFRRRRNPSRP